MRLLDRCNKRLYVYTDADVFQLGIGFIIAFEFYFYVTVRQIVNVFEYLLAWRGKKGTLRAALRQADNYDEWKKAAKELDSLLQFDEWKEVDEDGYFDYHLVSLCPAGRQCQGTAGLTPARCAGSSGL